MVKTCSSLYRYINSNIFIILFIILISLFVVVFFIRKKTYCQKILPTCSGKIMPFIKEGQFDTKGYIIDRNGIMKKTKGTVKIHRINDNKINYEITYVIEDDNEIASVTRNGFYEMDCYGHIHRIVNEYTQKKNNDNINNNDNTNTYNQLNTMNKHFQHGTATTIEDNVVICEGSGSNHTINRNHPCFQTEIRKVNDNEYEFYASVNNNIIDYVKWFTN